MQEKMDLIDEKMQEVMNDFDALNSYSKQRQELEEELEIMTLRWMELEEKMEGDA